MVNDPIGDLIARIKNAAIRGRSKVSKPGRRVYSSIKDLKPVKNGLGISILSTPKGVMSDTSARDANVGGEVLCRVY
jgi:small subunit ribosomal protein S8